MLTLRLSQSSLSDDRYRIELRLEGDGVAPQSASADVTCEFSDRDRDDIRWYLEIYPQYPIDPNPEIAGRVERRMEEIGATLFRSLFQANDDTRDLWVTLRAELKDTRVEISTGVEGTNEIPWELLRDPKTDIPLALSAQTFVRAQSKTAQRPQLPKLGTDEPIRILLVICRPGRDDDVPFRSVALRLLEGLTEEQRAAYTLDVLRPPTYDRLAETLRRAKDDGKPYHVVHFDGHGAYVENNGGGGFMPSPLMFSETRTGHHGYLVFEKPAIDENREFISGPKLGALLYETGVPVLVLNACRSAHAESSPSLTPSPIGGGEGVGESADVHEQVRAFGSLAQEVVDAGVAGVIAMRYNVFVVTAARFVGEMYGALARGQALGRAATYGRKRLHDDPHRDVVEPITLQDWSVPVIYEAAPIRLFPEREAASLQVALGAALREPQSGLDPNLPPPPDAGFYGRDETLLALDRAFDTENVVLLHGYAGSGKTATAAEFARWYAATGGLRLPNGLTGPVLFASFEQYLPLPRALDQFGAIFDATLQASGIHWLALTDEQRAQVALMVLQQVPVLWVWDNVEPVTGFPAGSDTPWSIAEQAALCDFLRACRGTKARVVLTSRRDEHAWLGNVPRRISLPPMPRREQVQLARALARKLGRALEPLRAWEPLLLYTAGNPLTLTVVVGQALRDGLHTEKQIRDYVDRLRNGEDAFPDEKEEGRSRSLGASLAYGFDAAFTDDERRALALLYLFQGFADADTLRIMTAPKSGDWGIPGMRDFDRQRWITLLDRASEIGLLTTHGSGYYTIHPALPWFFRRLFEQYWTVDGRQQTADKEEDSPRLPSTDYRLLAPRAYVESMGELGNYYHDQYGDGNRDVIGALRAEEANLLHAWRMARAHGWWDRVISVMQGLRVLYDHTGRRAEWRALVEAVEPEFVDTATGGPLPGREEPWGLVSDYRVRLAREVRNLEEAERLQGTKVSWSRSRSLSILHLDDFDEQQKEQIRTSAIDTHELGQIQREQGKAECVQAYEEAVDLLHRIGDRAAEAGAAFNLGRAYTDLPALRDLDAAERWYKRSLELLEEGDRQGQAKCFSQLGLMAYERFEEARERISEHVPSETEGSTIQRKRKEAEQELLGYLNEALKYYHQALEFDSPDNPGDLAVDHNQLGLIYKNAGDVARAVRHYNEAVRYSESAGDFYSAGRWRYNVALMLAQQDRFADALAYARAALRDFQQYQGRAAEDEEQTRRLVVQIEQAMAADHE